MIPRTVLTRSGPISLNTARPVNTVQSRTSVNNAGPMKNVINNAYSTDRRSFNKITVANNSNFTKKVNTVKGTKVNTARPKAVLSAVEGNKRNVVKASACWVWRPKHKVLDHGNLRQDLKNKGVIDSRCSRHMTGDELDQEKAKKQKIDDDQEEAKLKELMKVISDEEGVAIDAIPLSTKPPSIVDYKIIKEGKINIYQIIRADGSSKRYSAIIYMLKKFDREDLETLWKIVKARHEYTRPEEGYERVLWVI
ncbi:hypothetical protein Tco_0897242 [Tanacetum coccineum]